MLSEFEKILRYGRKDKKLSQHDVADRAGLSITTIAKLESGLFIPLEDESLCKIAVAVGADPSILISLYRSVFRSELRQQKNNAQDSQYLNARNECCEHDTNKYEHKENDDDHFFSDLARLEREIMTMPKELQRSLMQTIQMLVQAQIHRFPTMQRIIVSISLPL